MELKAVYICSICGHKEEGINIKECAECQTDEVYPEVDVDDLCLLPTLTRLAGQIDSDEAREKVERIFTDASYSRIFDIIYEAEAALRVLLKKTVGTEVGRSGNLGVIADLGKDVGELASALGVIAKL